MTPAERAELKAILDQRGPGRLTYLARLALDSPPTPSELTEETVALIRSHLQHNDQRPCSWHEVEDCIAELVRKARGGK